MYSRGLRAIADLRGIFAKRWGHQWSVLKESQGWFADHLWIWVYHYVKALLKLDLIQLWDWENVSSRLFFLYKATPGFTYHISVAWN